MKKKDIEKLELNDLCHVVIDKYKGWAVAAFLTREDADYFAEKFGNQYYEVISYTKLAL